jgi:hypothetical protein
MLQKLLEVLNLVDKPVELYKSPDGSTVLMLPYGGRVLGLFGPRSTENFLWTNPALESAESARTFYNSEAWHNSGGDRTWLAPELDFFFPGVPDMQRYWQPRQLDPGNYEVLREESKVILANQLTMSSARSHRSVDLVITKWVGPALNPLRYEPEWKDVVDIEYAGYTLHTSLKIVDKGRDGSPRVGLWNLLQLPHCGELLIPTYRRAQPKALFGETAAEDLQVGDHLIRYRMRAPGDQKFAFRAVDTTGRVGYIYSVSHQSVLMVRNFLVNPSGEYVDVPWLETADFGYAVQSCNVSSGHGTFSELEYHVPAIGEGTDNDRSDDVSQVWAFRGSPARIQKIASRLLSSSS